MLDSRQQALSQEHPEVRPLFESYISHTQRLNAAIRRRDGIVWRLDQIPERAVTREGEERQKLLDRAAVLEQELRESIVEAEGLRETGTPIEAELRLKRLEVMVAGSPEARAVFEEYAAKVRAVPCDSMDIDAFADAVVEAKRLHRGGVLRGDIEPSPELIAANARISDQYALFEHEQQQRFALAQEYETKLKRLLQPAPLKRR